MRCKGNNQARPIRLAHTLFILGRFCERTKDVFTSRPRRTILTLNGTLYEATSAASPLNGWMFMIVYCGSDCVIIHRGRDAGAIRRPPLCVSMHAPYNRIIPDKFQAEESSCCSCCRVSPSMFIISCGGGVLRSLSCY